MINRIIMFSMIFIITSMMMFNVYILVLLLKHFYAIP
jgi:hypothetical protein